MERHELSLNQINKLNGISKINLDSPHDVIAVIQNNIMGKEYGKLKSSIRQSK